MVYTLVSWPENGHLEQQIHGHRNFVCSPSAVRSFVRRRQILRTQYSTWNAWLGGNTRTLPWRLMYNCFLLPVRRLRMLEWRWSCILTPEADSLTYPCECVYIWHEPVGKNSIVLFALDCADGFRKDVQAAYAVDPHGCSYENAR